MAIHLEMVSILAIFRGKQRDFCFVPQQVLFKVVVWSSILLLILENPVMYKITRKVLKADIILTRFSNDCLPVF